MIHVAPPPDCAELESVLEIGFEISGIKKRAREKRRMGGGE
jgi:hypothetical protein